jgi:hypothetical protein
MHKYDGIDWGTSSAKPVKTGKAFQKEGIYQIMNQINR